MASSNISVLGWGAVLLAAFMVLPGIVSFGVGETQTGLAFITGAGLTVFAGGTAIVATRGTAERVDLRGGFLTATLLWIILPAFGAIPFALSGEFISLMDAYFEALSGFTTNGASVLANPETASRGILMWRALLQWLGGFSAILLALALLAFGGIGGMNLFNSPMARGERDTLVGRTERAARSLWWIYAGLTALCILALVAVGLSPFDAATHALSTISTGGFSTRAAGIAAFDSLGVEVVVMAFMAVGALNFTLVWALARGNPRALLRDVETHYLIAIVIAATAIVAGALIALEQFGAGAGIRIALFDVISALTTTGYSASAGTASATLPVIVPVMLMGLMLIGGASGSAAGGMRLMRLSVFFRLAGRELARLSYPHGVVRLRYGGQVIDETTLRSVWGQLMIFLSLLALSAVVFGVLGFDLQGALALAATTLSTSGAGLPLTAPHLSYAAFDDVTKWVLCAGMLFGRLELLVVLVLFTPAYWRK